MLSCDVKAGLLVRSLKIMNRLSGISVRTGGPRLSLEFTPYIANVVSYLGSMRYMHQGASIAISCPWVSTPSLHEADTSAATCCFFQLIRTHILKRWHECFCIPSPLSVREFAQRSLAQMQWGSHILNIGASPFTD